MIKQVSLGNCVCLVQNSQSSLQNDNSQIKTRERKKKVIYRQGTETTLEKRDSFLEPFESTSTENLGEMDFMGRAAVTKFKQIQERWYFPG